MKRNSAARLHMLRAGVLCVVAAGFGASGVPGMHGAPSAWPRTIAALPTCGTVPRLTVVPGIAFPWSVAASGPHDLWVSGATAGGGASVLRWNGRVWQRAMTGLPAGAGLRQLAAAGPSTVWAGGSLDAARPDSPLLLARWQGTRWQLVPSPAPLPAIGTPAASPRSQLSWSDAGNLAVVSLSSIWLNIEPGFSRPALRHWTGQSWQTGSTRGQPDSMHVTRIAPIGTAGLWVAGQESDGSAALYRYDGAGWHDTPPGIPSAGATPRLGAGGSAVGRESHLSALSVFSSSSTWAVGATMISGGEPGIQMHGLALAWDGTRWHDVPVPYAGAAASLSDVVLAGPQNAWVLSLDGLGLLHWNGARWSVVPTAWGQPDLITGAPPSDVLVAGTRTARDGSQQTVLALYHSGACS